MAFGREVDYGVGLVGLEQILDKFRVADISMHKNMARTVLQRGQIFQIPGIGQFVYIDDCVTSRAAGKDIAGADEPGTSGNKQCSHIFPRD